MARTPKHVYTKGKGCINQGKSQSNITSFQQSSSSKNQMSVLLNFHKLLLKALMQSLNAFFGITRATNRIYSADFVPGSQRLFQVWRNRPSSSDWVTGLRYLGKLVSSFVLTPEIFNRDLKGVNWDSWLRRFWETNFPLSIPENRLFNSGVEKPIRIILNFWITNKNYDYKNLKLGSRSLNVAIAVIGILKFWFWIL